MCRLVWLVDVLVNMNRCVCTHSVNMEGEKGVWAAEISPLLISNGQQVSKVLHQVRNLTYSDFPLMYIP